jgi:preprotein translocase subunit SecA
MTPALMRQLERRVVLGVIDRKWREHLYEMDYLQDGIGLRAMAQRNPLVEYQREGFDMFQAMTEGIKEETVRLVFAAQLNVAAPRPRPAWRSSGTTPRPSSPSTRRTRRRGPRTRQHPSTPPTAPVDAPAAPAVQPAAAAVAPDGAPDEATAAPDEVDPAAFSVPGLDQRVGALTYSAPTLDGDETGARPAKRSPARPPAGAPAGETNRAQRRAAAKNQKRS